MPEPIFGFNAQDIKRIGEAVRDYESSPARRPVSLPSDPIIAPSRVVAFELVSDVPDVNGLYDVLLLRRKPTGGYEAISTVKVKLEDLNS